MRQYVGLQSALLAAALLTWRGGHSTFAPVTFLVASDTHAGAYIHGVSALDLNLAAVREMAATPGMAWPAGLGGGRVGEPRGLVVTGDLIDAGSDNNKCWQQWEQWVSVFGLTGQEAALTIPVYEGFGNHDGGNTSGCPGECNIVRHALQLRNSGRRSKLSATSQNELHYSWDWGQLHLVHLNLYPGDAHEYSQEWQRGSWQYPEFSLSFLKTDLAGNVGHSGRPVCIFFHYGFDSSWSKLWWTDHERALFGEAVARYNVVAVFVGHTHAAMAYQWEGLNIINSPSTVRADDQQILPPSFMVVEVDFEAQTMRVAQREGAGWGPVSIVKNITLAVLDASHQSDLGMGCQAKGDGHGRHSYGAASAAHIPNLYAPCQERQNSGEEATERETDIMSDVLVKEEAALLQQSLKEWSLEDSAGLV